MTNERPRCFKFQELISDAVSLPSGTQYPKGPGVPSDHDVVNTSIQQN